MVQHHTSPGVIRGWDARKNRAQSVGVIFPLTSFFIERSLLNLWLWRG